MRILFCTVCIFLVISGGCYADEFIPPNEKDPPILNAEALPEDFLPLGITSASLAVAGLAVTTIGFLNIYNSIENGFENPKLQAGIVMTAGGGLLTAAAALIIDFILENTKESN